MDKKYRTSAYILATILVVVIFYIKSASASGSIFGQANVYDQTMVRPTVGLKIYEPINRHFAFNSFTGFGMVPYELSDDTTWLMTKNQMDYIRQEWTFSPGVELKYLLPYEDLRSVFFLKVERKLW